MDNFFAIIGAQRCGTTSLATLLSSHQEIRMATPLFPEPKFFLSEHEFAKGKKYYLDKYFKEVDETKIIGEKSTSYIEIPKAGERILEFFPDAKMIVLLRNPVERALSNYFYSRKNHIETRTLEEVFIQQKPLNINEALFSVSPVNYLGRGEYLKYLKEYYHIFKKENIHVALFEELIRDASSVKRVFEFLEISTPERLQPMERSNESKRSVSIGEEIREKLKEYYKPHNEALEDFLKIDLKIWERLTL